MYVSLIPVLLYSQIMIIPTIVRRMLVPAVRFQQPVGYGMSLYAKGRNIEKPTSLNE